MSWHMQRGSPIVVRYVLFLTLFNYMVYFCYKFLVLNHI